MLQLLALFIGIDVSKDTLDVAVFGPDGLLDTFKVSNDKKGFDQIHKRLSVKGAPQTWHINLEATSAYHRAFVLWMAELGVKVLILNPKQARDLAKGLGVLRKSDHTDAIVLGQCAKMAWREPTALASGKPYELQEISRRIGVLTRMRGSERKRLLKPGASEALVASLRRCIEFMTAELETLEAQWEALLAQCPEQSEIRKNILTVPGVGRASARVVVSELYATIGEHTSKQCVAYAGLAPQEQTSGTSLRRKGRLFSTGNKILRCALYMGAVSALRNDSESRDLYGRIVGAGKHKKIGIVAVMNKMLRRIAAVAKRKSPWLKA
jgi:transposase